MAGLTNAHVDTDTGYAYPDSLGFTWSDLTTWTAWTHWDANPYTSIQYVHELDAGEIAPMSVVVSVSADCTSYTIEEQHSDDNVTYTSYASLGAPFMARYVRVKIVPSGDYPILKDVTVSLSREKREQVVTDLDISTLTGSYRTGTGDVRIPATGFTAITGVSVAFGSTGAGYSFEVIDKVVTYGPRIKVYDSTGTLADCTIDAIIKGY